MGHQCFTCNQPVDKGNLRPASEVAVKCSTCVQGEVEYINNRPNEFPEAHLTMSQMGQRVKNENKRKRMQRRRAS